MAQQVQAGSLILCVWGPTYGCQPCAAAVVPSTLAQPPTKCWVDTAHSSLSPRVLVRRLLAPEKSKN